MKIFKFFISKIFLKRWLICILMVLLVFAADFITFSVARSILLAFQGFREVDNLEQNGLYITSLDSGSNMDFGNITKDDTQKVYDYLNTNFDYALFTDGFIISLPNDDNMEISLGYVNENYYYLNPGMFSLSDGEELNFDYQLDEGEIPVLIGAGLSSTYSVGSVITITDPVLEQTISLRVQGILKQNTSHSNYYILNSKNYYNFSIFIPLNEEFIDTSTINLQINGLMNLILLNSSENAISELGGYIQDTLGLTFDFSSQAENNEYFRKYCTDSIKIMSLTAILLLIIISCISIWGAMVSLRLMMKDFTINLLVGLDYSKLKKIFCAYFSILFIVDLAAVFASAAYSRYRFWLLKDSLMATYGLFGLIWADWLALAAVVILDIALGFVIIGITMRRIKKMPISIGVLQ